MLIAILTFLLHSVWLFLTPLLAYKRYRTLWLAEGLALALVCGIFGFFIELLFLPDKRGDQPPRLLKDMLANLTS